METKPVATTEPAPRKRRLWRRLGKPLFFTLAFFLIVEITIRVVYAVRNAQVEAVPLPYVIGHDYGPLPPWLGDLTILTPDDDLIWKTRPNLRRRYVDIFSPIGSDAERRSLLRRFGASLPEAWRDNPSWEIAVNSDGFRGDEFPKQKAACRVVCMGDSWTFGMNVGQDETYPRRLQALMREAAPQADFEVLNLGVLGYSSYQGLELLKKKALDLNPDILVIGYAMNDAKVTGTTDPELAARVKSPPPGERIGRLLTNSETYNLLAYYARLARFQPKPISHYLREEAGGDDDDDGGEPGGQNDKGEDPYEWLSKARVPPKDYEENVREMVRLARGRGASVVLVYNELWQGGPYLKALGRVAASEGVPLVDGSTILAEARRQVEQDLERKLGLAPPAASGGAAPPGHVEVVFRVSMGQRPVPRAVCIAGTHQALGDAEPNKVALYDDGTHGDQKAGDGVWSLAVTVRAGRTLHYVYTNSGPEGQWEGLDVPHLREVQVEGEDAGKRVYLPIESFGKIHMQADGWHPNADGYGLIARRVFEVLQRDEKVRGAVRRPGER